MLLANVMLVAKREYLERVKTKAFVLSTVLIPIFFFGFMLIAAMLTKKDSGAHHIAIVSQDAALSNLIKQEIVTGADGAKFKIDTYTPSEGLQKQLDTNITEGKLEGFLLIGSENAADTSKQMQSPGGTYYSNSASDIPMQQRLSSAVRNAYVVERMKGFGVPEKEVDGLMRATGIDLQTIGVSRKSDSTATIFGAVGLMLLLYMTVLLHGINVGRSIVEEKTSRVFEVMLSVIRPDDLLAGKILGVGSVGLTQIGIWLASTGILAAFGLSMAVGGMGKVTDAIHQMPLASFFAFALCYVLGYIYYSSVAAMFGSMVNSEQEMQQMNMFVVMPLASCMAFLYPVIVHPDAWYSVALSLFPPTAPLIMFLRVTMHQPPAWELLLSLGLMFVAIYLVIWLASRIYRVGILMYGKRPNLPEILRWIRYS